MTLIKLMETISRQKSRIFLLMLFLSAHIVYAQNISVNGIVTDVETGEPLIGVSVFSDKLQTGTITDVDGHFSLSVPVGTTLSFTYIGYNSLSLPAKESSLSVAMRAQAYEIDDVVVVGTRMRKSDLTGAVGGISEKQLKEVPTTDLVTAMQGKVPGLLITRNDAAPGAGVQVKVRGTNSINYGTDPVYVVDGMIVENGLKLISPDDIASIEVLKDASSTALYGSRASNGVVVITTKKGKKGEGKINYSGFATVSKYQDRLKQLNARQLYDLRIEAYANGYMDRYPGANRQEYIDNYLTIADPEANVAFSMEELENGQNGVTSNWVDHILQTAVTQNHSLNFSGATDKTVYYLGFTYSDEKGLVKNTDYRRYTGKINLEQEVKPWLKVGTNTTLSQGTRHILGGDEGNPYGTAFHANPLQTIDKERVYIYWQGTAKMDSYNPLLSLDVEREEVHNRVLSSNFIEANPIKDLYIRTTYAVDIFNRQDNRYIPSYTGQSIRDNYEGIGWQWRGNDIYWQWDTSVSYEKIFNKHRLFGLFSTGVSEKNHNKTEVKGYKFPTDDMGFHNMGYASNKELNTMGSDYTSSTLVSFTGRVNYSYEMKYFLTATIRHDGSSRFDKSNRWGTFPSFSAAWNMKEEGFLKDADWLDLLKLRLGYGILGNQNIPNYAYLTVFNPVYSDGEIGLVVDGEDSKKRYENKDIRWEKQKQWNAGVDVSFWNDRLSFGLDAFHMINSDLLMKMNLYPSYGYDYKIANIAELKNRGVEFSFNAQLIRTKDFSWSLSGNIAHDRNEVTKLYDGADVIWNGGNVSSREGHLFVGQSLNTIYAFKLGRIAQESDMEYLNQLNGVDENGQPNIEGGKKVRPGDYLPYDRNGDGKITYLDDMYVVGKKDPKFYGGFSTYLSYKNFSLDAVFTYSYGAKRTSYAYETMMNGNGTGIASVDMLNRWTPENTNTSVPRAWRGDSETRFNMSDFDISALDASFLRCAAMTLSYNMPNKLIRSFASDLRIYASGNNLFLITPYKGYDPEAGESYPLTRSFTVGLNVTF